MPKRNDELAADAHVGREKFRTASSPPGRTGITHAARVAHSTALSRLPLMSTDFIPYFNQSAMFYGNRRCDSALPVSRCIRR